MTNQTPSPQSGRNTQPLDQLQSLFDAALSYVRHLLVDVLKLDPAEFGVAHRSVSWRRALHIASFTLAAGLGYLLGGVTGAVWGLALTGLAALQISTERRHHIEYSSRNPDNPARQAVGVITVREDVKISDTEWWFIGHHFGVKDTVVESFHRCHRGTVLWPLLRTIPVLLALVGLVWLPSSGFPVVLLVLAGAVGYAMISLAASQGKVRPDASFIVRLVLGVRRAFVLAGTYLVSALIFLITWLLVKREPYWLGVTIVVLLSATYIWYSFSAWHRRFVILTNEALIVVFERPWPLSDDSKRYGISKITDTEEITRWYWQILAFGTSIAQIKFSAFGKTVLLPPLYDNKRIFQRMP